MADEQQQQQQPHAKVTGDFHNITVEDLYDKEKYDLSTMEQQDVMQLLQYVFPKASPIRCWIDTLYSLFLGLNPKV